MTGNAPRPSRRSARALPSALPLLAAVLCSACLSDMVEPAIDIEGRRMVVIPFKDATSYHYFSARGNRLTRMLTRSLDRFREADGEDAIEVVAYEELIGAVGDEDPTDLAHTEVAGRVEADTILIGAIEQFEPMREKDVGMLRGRAEVALRVIEAAKPEGKPLLVKKIKVIYPPEDDFRSWGGLPVTDGTVEEVEKGLMAKLAEEIGKLFRHWEPPPRR